MKLIPMLEWGSFKRRWQPSAAQKKEYRERMQSIEAERSKSPMDGYDIGCTGDCCVGDEIAFFNPGKAGERLYGKIISDSYGKDKQQHTFTIEVDGEKMMIKGRNLYRNGVLRKRWDDEEKRKEVLDDKHERGDVARAAAKQRRADKENDLINGIR